MAEIKQNTLFLSTSGNYINRDHLTLRIECEKELKLAVPIHHIESICSFGNNTFSPFALKLCWENKVPVNCFTENGFFLGRWEGVPNTSVVLRRTQYRKADDAQFKQMLAATIVNGKIRNSRQNVMRASRATKDDSEKGTLKLAAAALAGLAENALADADALDSVRGYEGQAAAVYFECFDLQIRKQKNEFFFKKRSRRPPLDYVNCLLSYLYALVRHDCISALTAVGLDPFVGFLHSERPTRPSLALDLMEEFRPAIADKIAVAMINLKQISASDFNKREGGAIEFTDDGRKKVITAYQTRKQDTIIHPVLDQEYRYGELFFAQARILARYLREDIPAYYPFVVR
ncbi:MAG: type I-C CRISPR-associated endonuclease Cas1c [Pyrinomonadaceae bacterium]